MMDKNREYWEDGSSYGEYVSEELADERKELWKNRIMEKTGKKENMRVLDAGCGPGFFSCILSEEGHRVTGIDRSADMLRIADKNAKKLGIYPEFKIMDLNELDFCSGEFDLIISRNVTWTLRHPVSVYENFYRKLKKGGILLIYDANWHLPFYDEKMLAEVRKNEENCLKTFGIDFKVYDEDRGIFDDLPLSNIRRPQWDVDVLKKIGYEKILTDLNVGNTLYKDWERMIYSATPLFEISAQK